MFVFLCLYIYIYISLQTASVMVCAFLWAALESHFVHACYEVWGGGLRLTHSTRNNLGVALQAWSDLAREIALFMDVVALLWGRNIVHWWNGAPDFQSLENTRCWVGCSPSTSTRSGNEKWQMSRSVNMKCPWNRKQSSWPSCCQAYMQYTTSWIKRPYGASSWNCSSPQALVKKLLGVV
jgi:hypothetical protein